MPIKILMPALSPTMTEGNLAKWLKKEGDTIAAGDVIAEIETDKATMEFEATDEGTLGRILIAAGTDGVKVNDAIAWLLEDGESVDMLDQLDGARTTADQIEPDSTTGKLDDITVKTSKLLPEPDVCKDYLNKVNTPHDASQHILKGQADPHASENKIGVDVNTGTKSDRLFVSPLARRIADHAHIDLYQIKGTGPKGRIVKCDVENFQQQQYHSATNIQPAGLSSAAKSISVPSVPSNVDGYLPTYDDIKLSNMRKVIAKRLTEAKQLAPHFYLSIDVELDALLALRLDINKAMVDEQQRVSVNDFIIKACALALKEVPAANSSFAETHVRQYHTADISVAVAVEGGLVTPVIRAAESKSLSEISATVKELVKKARAGKLMPEDYQGGTFSLSNLGMYGIKSFAAIINPPQGCILAVGAGVQKPVVKNNQLAIATVMNCTLSVDHRVVDGAVGAEFFKSFRKYITHPVLMLV